MGLHAAPVDRTVYELFALQGDLVGDALAELSKSLLEGRSRYARLRELEHACDELTVQIYELTHRPSAAPLELERFLALASALDDVVDLAEETSDKLELYRLGRITEQARSAGECLARAGAELAAAVGRLERPDGLAELRAGIGRACEDGARDCAEGIHLLREDESMTSDDVAAWRAIYDLLTGALAACEHAASLTP